jgi:hypothetical protein
LSYPPGGGVDLELTERSLDLAAETFDLAIITGRVDTSDFIARPLWRCSRKLILRVDASRVRRDRRDSGHGGCRVDRGAPRDLRRVARASARHREPDTARQSAVGIARHDRISVYQVNTP